MKPDILWWFWNAAQWIHPQHSDQDNDLLHQSHKENETNLDHVRWWRFKLQAVFNFDILDLKRHPVTALQTSKIKRKLVFIFCSWSVDYVSSRAIILKSKENQNKGNHKSEEVIYLSVIPYFHLYFISPTRCRIWKKEKPFPMNLYSSQHKLLTSKPSLPHT